MTCPHPHVVVTGASSGIGRATVLRLADAGWHVYAGVRRSGDGEALIRASKSGNITPLVMDVTEPDEISAGAETVDRHVGAAGLNALVDNAGIGVAVPMELVETEALRRQFEVNVFGQVAVTQEFLPLLRRARGHLVVIGSIGDRFTPPFGGPLAASKAAIATITDAFRQELALWGIRVVLMEPASIHTDAVDKLERDAIEAANEFSHDGFAEFFTNQFNQRWNSGDLWPRERALACLAADVLNQTLDESFALHADLAIAAGAGREQIERGASAGGRVRDHESVACLPSPGNSLAFRCSTDARSSSLSPE